MFVLFALFAKFQVLWLQACNCFSRFVRIQRRTPSRNCFVFQCISHFTLLHGTWKIRNGQKINKWKKTCAKNSLTIGHSNKSPEDLLYLENVEGCWNHSSKISSSKLQWGAQNVFNVHTTQKICVRCDLDVSAIHTIARSIENIGNIQIWKKCVPISQTGFCHNLQKHD